jgi:hypothetical protein
MRFDTEYILGQLQLYWKFVFPMLLVTIPALYRFGMYRRVWRYASTPEVAAVVGAVSLGSVALALSIIPALGWISGQEARGFPRSVIAINWMCAIALIGGSRFLLRSLSEAQANRRRENGNGQRPDPALRTLVVGAGDAGAMVVRELLHHPELGLRPLAFLVVVNAVFLILGCIIDATTMLLVLVPVLLPTVAALGIDPVYFGVLIVINITIGLVTPPYGLLLFVLAALTKIPLREIIAECWGLIGALVAALALMVAFPSLVLWLPRLLGYVR